VSTAHWQNRVHDENNREIWLVLDGSDVRDRLKLLLDEALAELDRHASDAALRDLWLTGYGSGLTKFQLLLNLVLLLDQIGPAGKLAPALQALRVYVDGTPQAGVARYILGERWPRESPRRPLRRAAASAQCRACARRHAAHRQGAGGRHGTCRHGHRYDGEPGAGDWRADRSLAAAL
jgi:hypothetical protein